MFRMFKKITFQPGPLQFGTAFPVRNFSLLCPEIHIIITIKVLAGNTRTLTF